MSRLQLGNLSAIFSLAAFSLCGAIDIGPVLGKVIDLPSIPGRILVKVDSSVPIAALDNTARKSGARSVQSFDIIKGLHLYEFDSAGDFDAIRRAFLENPAVQYVEPDYVYTAQDVNDPRFPEQWALENTGLNQGTSDADINAQATWAIEQGDSNVVIGIIDTGMDYTHPDLIQNVWSNSNEIPGNNIDDDQNGFVDDIHGINTLNSSGDPMDDNLHGTHVAGTIGAAGNNSIGVVGVAQNVQIASCKFLSAAGSGAISDALTCMEYFAKLKARTKNPVNLVATNNSWGGGSKSLSMQHAIEAHRDLGILFIAAAGNESNNNDIGERYPCNYDVANVISVAATDKNDALATFSNYGKTKVHVAAPGVKILSTVLNHGYGLLSGTSMATPHVTGLAAIIAANQPSLNFIGIKNLIMTGGQKIAAAKNNTISGRRIRGADVNGVGSLTCKDQALLARLEPKASSSTIKLSDQIFLKATAINCASPAGNITLAQDITLSDDGQNGDVTAGDGVYSLLWHPQAAGVYDLKFSDDDIVHVTVSGDAPTNPRGYKAYDDVNFEYSHIQGTSLGATDESMHWVRAPFAIPFAGDESGFTDLFISTNGTISFTDASQPGYTNLRLPGPTANTLISPYWDDLNTLTSNSDIYVDVLGNAPSRKVVVEWWRVKQYNANGLGAFQAIFYEDSSDIRFNYLDTNFSSTNHNYGKSATVGVQTSTQDGMEYSYNWPSVPSGKSILFKLE